MDTEICVILSTTDTMEHAEMIADTLVFERLAACVQIGRAIESRYFWKGETHKDTEFPISIKTSKECLGKLRERFMQLHTYECPQWICLKAEASQSYAKWVEDSCGK